MGFYGNRFCFDGIPCEEFGLALYDIDGSAQESEVPVASAGEVIDDWIPSRSKSFFYGIQQNEPLSFNMVFGVNPELTRQKNFPTMDDFLDRWEIAKINNWLTGHGNEMKWLEVEQADMEMVRFRCVITELKIITYGWYPWAYSCTVTCDSPYGYMYPKTYKYTCSGTKECELRSKSLINELYYPKMTIIPRKAGEISIINETVDANRPFLISSLPPSSEAEISIDVDNENMVIHASNNLNVYNYFNFNFFRLRSGQNKLTLKGDFDLKIVCEFPVNVGG